MRVVNMDHLGGRQVDAFGSRNFTVFHLLPQAHVVAASVGAGGSIGEHPAVVDQLLVLVAGRAIVAGGDGQHQEVTSGQGVLWTAHESHRTDALTDITALIIEGGGPRRRHESDVPICR